MFRKLVGTKTQLRLIYQVAGSAPMNAQGQPAGISADTVGIMVDMRKAFRNSLNPWLQEMDELEGRPRKAQIQYAKDHDQSKFTAELTKIEEDDKRLNEEGKNEAEIIVDQAVYDYIAKRMKDTPAYGTSDEALETAAAALALVDLAGTDAGKVEEVKEVKSEEPTPISKAKNKK